MIRTALTVLVILCALALSSVVVHAETEEICGFEGPDIKYELELTDFVVRGPKPTEVGDDVVVEFNLRYVGDDPITFDGVFVAAKLPDGSEKRFIESHQGKTLNAGDSVSVRGEIELSMEGKWIIWPSFIYYHDGDVFGPIDPWHECVIVVKSQAPPEPTSSKPDLFLDSNSIWFNYTMRTIFFRIWNIGDADSGEFNVTLYIDGEVVETKRVGSIPAGVVLTDHFRFSYGPCGEPMTGREDEIRVYVDSGYEIDEESEFNNEKEFTLNCPVMRPDLVIQDVWLGDATVWKEIRPGVYGLVNMPNTVFFRIYNCGCVDQEFNVTLYIDGEVVETKRVSIPARGTIEDHFDFSYGLSEEPCTGREDEIKVSVDEPPFTYFGGIQESNEDNNEMTIMKECPPRPDLVIGRIWLDNGGVKYEIKNVGDAEAPQSETLLSIRDGYGEQAVTYEAYDRVEPLDAGESRIEMFENFQFFCDPTVGTYHVYVEADEPDDVVEVNENNNFNTSTFLCWKPADLIIEDVWLEGFTIKYKIKNNGTLDAGESVTSLRAGVQLVCYDEVDDLGPGESGVESFENCIFDWSNFGAEVTVTLVADVYDDVRECRGGVGGPYEENNEYTEVWRNPGFVKVTGRILYQEAEALSGSSSNPGPLNLGGFKPFRFGKLRIESVTDNYKSHTILTDSQGYFSAYIPRVEGRVLRIHIGGEDMHDQGMNYAVKVARDYDWCNEYVSWDSTVTKTIPESGDIDFGELKIGAEKNFDFEGLIRETYIWPGWPCGGEERPLEGGSAYFNIAETILVGRMYADGNRADSDQIGKVSVAYPDTSIHDIAWQNPFFDEIYLPPPNNKNGYKDLGFVDEVILHEYAHHLTEEISENDWALAEHDPCFEASGLLDPGEFAWFEGFAEYFAHFIINNHSDPSDPYHLSDVDTDFSGYENPTCAGDVPTLLQEGGVTAFLIDLVDEPGAFRGSVNENFDNIRGLDGMIFHIFDTEMDNVVDAPDICEFAYGEEGLWERARDRGYPSESDLQALWNHYRTYCASGG